MADIEKHLILHRLDDPLRILKWTVDEALLGMIVPFIGLIINHPYIGLISGVGSAWLLIKVKAFFGGGTLKHALYWYFPHNKKKLKATPPSYIREYIG